MAQHTFIGSYTPGVNINAQKPVAGEIRYNVGTQHMESYDGSAWHTIIDNPFDDHPSIQTGEERFGDCNYWVQVTVPGLFSQRRQKNLEIHEWVVLTYGPSSEWGYGRWTASDERYWFKEEKDRAWFVLRWTA